VKLRGRLALTTFAALMIGGTLIYMATEWWRDRQADGVLLHALESAMIGDGRARCEAQPATFGGGELDPIPPLAIFGPIIGVRPQIFAYSAALTSANPAAPPFPEDLRGEVEAGKQAIGSFPVAEGQGRQLALRMPWRDGPCAVLLGRFGGFIIPPSTQILRGVVIVLFLVGTSLVGALPIIARIRRLTSAVKRSAASMYAVGVPTTGDDEIGELERAFNRAAEQVKTHLATIEAREATLRSVVATTAHDVAIPLTVVQGHLSTLQSLVPPGGPAHEGLRGAIRETHYLGALLHNLGVAARLDRATAELERHPLDLSALVTRVIARHSPLAATVDVELGFAVPEEPLHVVADVTLLEQAASNLVHNAIHYNNAGGHVALTLETAESGRRFVLRVVDDGPGIPAEERAHLTEAEYRGTAGRARRPEGQGLGLHIVREVVRRHGFDLRIGESEYGGAEIAIEGSCSAPD
jgi:signal transduction histidine kinase